MPTMILNQQVIISNNVCDITKSGLSFRGIVLGRVQSFTDPSTALETLTTGANLFPNYVLIHRNRGDVYSSLLRHEVLLWILTNNSLYLFKSVGSV